MIYTGVSRAFTIPQMRSSIVRNCYMQKSANATFECPQMRYSERMIGYRSRLIDSLIVASLDTFGAVILEGPRAVGKTTTALAHAKSSVRLDSSPAAMQLAELSPAAILEGETPRLVDEWQLAPSIWNAVRHEVDTRASTGQFILTGSSTPSDDTTRHSGAGRFRRVRLRPMSLSESGESTAAVDLAAVLNGASVAAYGGPTVEDYAQLVVRGGWPTLVSSAKRDPSDYLASYVDDVSRVDLPDMGYRVDPVRMRTLMLSLARHTSAAPSLASLARESEISPSQGATSAQTVRRYVDALSRAYVVEELPAWVPHLRSRARLRTSPTWHFSDPSLSAAALGATPQGLLQDLNTFGLLFESLCVRDLRVYAHLIDGVVSHYRDESGLEADAIVEVRDGSWAAFEVKLGGEAAIDKAAANLLRLSERVTAQRRASLGALVVLTAGNASYVRPDGVRVISVGHLTVDSKH